MTESDRKWPVTVRVVFDCDCELTSDSCDRSKNIVVNFGSSTYKLNQKQEIKKLRSLGSRKYFEAQNQFFSYKKHYNCWKDSGSSGARFLNSSLLI